MNLKEVLKNSSAGILVTDKEFKIIWANQFEEDYYQQSLQELLGLWVVNCHKEENRPTINSFLEKFRAGELKEFTKTANGMIITYSAYEQDGQFGGIVRTRIKMP